MTEFDREGIHVIASSDVMTSVEGLGPWSVAFFGATLCTLALVLGLYSVERLVRRSLLWFFAIALGLLIGVSQWAPTQAPLTNLAILLSVIPLAAWAGPLIRDRGSFLVLLVFASLTDLSANVGTPLVIEASQPSAPTLLRVLVIQIPWADTIVRPLIWCDLAIVAIIVSASTGLGGSRYRSGLGCLLAFACVFALERYLGRVLAHAPFLAIFGLFAIPPETLSSRAGSSKRSSPFHSGF